MQSSVFPPPGPASFRLALVFFAMCAFVAGCSETDPRATIITISQPSANPQIARDRDVAWIYHLAKTHGVDDLVTRLDRERSAAQIARAALPSNKVFATSPPRSAPPIAVIPSGLDTSRPAAPAAPSAAPGNPLASLADPPLDPAISLALYTIDPRTYRRFFIDNYPVTSEGVDGDYGARLARAKLGAAVAPIAALESAAASGDDVAYAKLLEASSVANGSLADDYARAIAALFRSRPDDFLPFLVRMPIETRLAVVSSEAGWCQNPPRAILSSVPEDQDELALTRALRVTQTDCARRRAEMRHGGKKRGAKRHGGAHLRRPRAHP